MFKYGIIVIGYKNTDAIRRLLKALGNADYGTDEITLIIGIDHSGESAVKKIAESFYWEYGEKIIKYQSEHLGLKRHILTCGKYIDEYDLNAVAVFEDDVMPSCDFYQYMKAATEKYYYNRNIAGISLYLHQNNRNGLQEFRPVMNGQDAFFLKYPQSWGQVWMREQWREFYDWYVQNDIWDGENSGCREELPQNLMTWGDESWLKYHIKYCVSKNKYFVYPYISRSTCFHEKGVHTPESSNELQVVLPIQKQLVYDFPDWNREAVCYDAFFENECLYRYVGLSKDELEVDLYGMHTFVRKRYLLTIRELPYIRIRSWGKKLVPHDMNIIYDIQGNDIYLYDLGKGAESTVNIPVYVTKNKSAENVTILDRLLVCKENGIDLAQRLLAEDISSIAIYGCGIVGRHLMRALTGSGVKINYYIDQYTSEIEIEGIQVTKVENKLPYVDAIVITPTYDYEKIIGKLSLVYSGKMISVLTLVS